VGEGQQFSNRSFHYRPISYEIRASKSWARNPYRLRAAQPKRKKMNNDTPAVVNMDEAAASRGRQTRAE